MATLKLTIDKRRKYLDGRRPLIIRLTSNGKSTSINLGIRLFEQEWDQKKLRILKKHPNQKDLNILLIESLLNYEQKLRDIVSEKSNIKLAELRKLMTAKTSEIKITFYEFALVQINRLKTQKRFGNAQSYLTATNRIIEYGGKNLLLSEIDYSFIVEFETHLSNAGVSINGIGAYMRALRVMLNNGGKLGSYDMSKYPFNKFKIRTQKTRSRAEPLGKILELSDLKLKKNSEQFHAKKIFLLIFSLIGISFIDILLLKKHNLKNGRIVYRRRKTKKLYSIKVTPLAKKIFEFYNEEESDYLLPQFGLDGIKESKVRYQVNLGLKLTNRYLKQLGKQLNFEGPLTTYVARYSWANIAKSKGYSKDLIAEALGHNYGNAVTGIYLDDYGNEVIDSANEYLVSLIDIVI